MSFLPILLCAHHYVDNNISPPAQEAHYLPLPRPVRGAAPGAGGLGLPPADGRGGARQGQAVHTEAGTAGAGGNNTYITYIKMTGVRSRLLCCRAPCPRRASTGTASCSWPGRPRAQTVRTLTCVQTGGVGTGRWDGGRGDEGYYLDIGHSNDVIIVVQ